MKDTVTGRLIAEHLVEGTPGPGREIGLRIDQTLTQDATGTMVFLEFESLGLPRVKAGLSVSYIDHNIIQEDSRNFDDHRFLQSCAARFGVILSPAGNGVSHHVHRQRFGAPGRTLLGSDSHTTTGGCLGMLAMGAGGVEVALAMAGRPYRLLTPKVWGIRLEGRLPPFVSGKDLILELLRRHSCKAGIGFVLEFFGPGVANLDMSDRAAAANMAVDMGFTAGIFPSDSVTRDYLRRNGREGDWAELQAGSAPAWDKATEVDLGTVEPLVACPHNPDNVKRAAELSGVAIGQVLIGSSANGSYRDFMMAAKMLEGKVRNPGVDLGINPGSRQTLENVMAMGGLKSFIEAGARICEAGCLGCIGMGQAPGTGVNSLRTFPRNFKGRSGTKDDAVYLCSPETAAASALTGRITDPRQSGAAPKIEYPERFICSDSWLIRPPADGSRVDIVRGPNIKPLPVFEPLPESLQGTVLLKVGDNVSTDIILPAGAKVLPLRSDIPAISEFVFSNVDEGFARRARTAGGGFIVGGENYGQGSSREHAALAPRFLGIKAKLAKSFARIHKANLVNFGIAPLVFADPADYDAVAQGDRLEIPGLRAAVEKGAEQFTVLCAGREFAVRLDLTARERSILLAGGVLNQNRG
ncbi:MAG TPA: aconitate hydratase [Elusimicrobia bacterium]|nr:aconitate hydratase [Elusimicrobiota bacterium]